MVSPVVGTEDINLSIHADTSRTRRRSQGTRGRIALRVGCFEPAGFNQRVKDDSFAPDRMGSHDGPFGLIELGGRAQRAKTNGVGSKGPEENKVVIVAADASRRAALRVLRSE